MGTRESEVSGLGVLWCNVRLSLACHVPSTWTGVSLYPSTEHSDVLSR